MNNIDNYINNIDTGYSYRFAKKLERNKTNKKLGFRTAGSEAEIETGKIIAKEMKKIGLSNVKRDKITLDGWVFKKARLKYKDKSHNEWVCELGAYQTDLFTDGYMSFDLVYVGRGTAADYEDIDVRGKLVLVDINQRDEWWINYPVYEAYLHGAVAVLAAQAKGYSEIDDEALNAQDIAGPKEAAALSISYADATRLKKVLKNNESIKVSLNADTRVYENSKSYNIVGEIPGIDKDSYIMYSAHYDSYFAGFQDDNAAVGMLMGIAKAMCKSGIKPKHTILFVALCAEEWGVTDSKYDWSTGAYEEVNTVHPEWAGKVIADFNFELPAHAHGDKDGVRTIYEYYDFMKKALSDITVPTEAYKDGIVALSPIETMSDDFTMAVSGIPSHVNDFTSGEFMSNNYHSQYDCDDYYDEPVYQFHHELYGKLGYTYDDLLLPPMDFSMLFRQLKKSIPEDICIKAGIDLTEFDAVLKSAYDNSVNLYERINAINLDYKAKCDTVDNKAIKKLLRDAAPFREDLLSIFKKAQDTFVRLDWHDNVVFPHASLKQDLMYIDKVIDALKSGDIIKALEKTYRIDNNQYAFLFSKPTYSHFTDYILNQSKEKAKWGYGRIIHHTDLYDAVKKLKRKALIQMGTGKKVKDNVKEDIKFYKQVRTDMLASYEDDINYMLKSLNKINNKLIDCLNKYNELV